MDIGGWLRSLGLGQYEAVFHENEIDVEVLPELTESDLIQLRLPLGHRRRLLKAIAGLCQAKNGAEASGFVFAHAATASAERRQLTVMFCDLVGSTALSARLDPEDMGDLIRAFQAVVAAAVARFDGHVAKLMGDGTLVYFGYPRAHEDDAERAVRAGLGIVEAVEALRRERGVALEVRAGIATGLVVVGELMGEGEARERGVVGDTPNLAARLQALAEPGSVVVAESTRRLLGGTFDLNALGPQALKGFAAPVPAWLVVREAEHVTRFEASRSQGMTPFVGREHETALLLDRWRDASEGAGQVALLSGEAGIGKSRILAALRDQIENEPHVTVRYQCSPHHINDAFYPISSQIWYAAGFVSGEPAAARLDKLEAMIGHPRLDAKDIAPFLAALLSIPVGQRYPSLDMAPSEQKERTIAALLAVFEGLTKDAPVLALLEDAHWIDPTSLDVFSRLVDRLPGLPALLVIAFRPEFAAPWVSRAHVSLLSLNRFGRRQALAMIDRVAGGKALPEKVLEQIVAKTDGVPLFVEELTKNVLESDLLRDENGAYVLASALTPFAIPSTLQDSLMARLDRLAHVKEIAQIGAAIGREFSYRLLEAVSPIEGQALQDALGQLVAANLIHARGAPPDAKYIFKHALVQDTAYASLLRGRRQRIHADIAKTLVEGFLDQVDSARAVIAHHYTEAGLYEPAARHWLAAAELALSRSAALEADRHVDAGLAVILRMPEGQDRRSLELAFLVAKANALLPLKGYSTPETVAALTAAKRLLDAGVGDDLQHFSVLYGLCAAKYVASELESARALARQFADLADRQDDPIYRLVGYRLLGTVQFFMGRNREDLEILQQAESYRDPARQKQLSYRFGYDPSLSALCYKAMTLFMLGLVDEAMRARDQARMEAADHYHAPTVALCRFFTTIWPELLFGDFEACERHSAELVAYCIEKKVEQFRLYGVLTDTCARARRDPTAQHIAAIRAAHDAHHRSGARILDSMILSHLAEALLATGDVEGVEATLQVAFEFVETSGERFLLADLHRIAGRLAIGRRASERALAEACFLKAIEIARDQEARLLELRAATDLARLWRDTGSPSDPRALLQPILAAIEDGEEMRDVRDARALLAGIA
jgi:class 3 adenylate cyclase